VFLGVCGGLGEYFNADPVIVRVIAVLLTIFTGGVPGIIAYFVLALIIPLQGSSANTPETTFRENVSEIKDATTKMGENIRSTFEAKNTKPGAPGETPGTQTPVTPQRSANNGLYFLGAIIVAIGVFLLLINVFSWFWARLWPLWLIAAGLIIIIVVAARRK
jgi:phage shock protein PspC (stress-responsive transcriptional regulator)